MIRRRLRPEEKTYHCNDGVVVEWGDGGVGDNSKELMIQEERRKKKKGEKKERENILAVDGAAIHDSQ